MISISRLSKAIQKLATAASANLGTDCYLHAALAQKFLADNGVNTKRVIGYAAWRVGPGDGDVILHAPINGTPVAENACMYHAWLEGENVILDFTTYTLKEKGRLLDLQDGGHTEVTWCPEYLQLHKVNVCCLRDVIQESAGMCYYEHIPEVQAHVESTPHHIDGDDYLLLRLLYNHSQCQVVGPNHR